MTNTQKKNWTRTHVIFALRAKGSSVAALAAAAGLSRFTVYGALERPYPRVQRLIARALGVRRCDIWPEFYTSDDKRPARTAQLIGFGRSKRAA